MSEHIQKSDHAARQSRRGGKRLAAGQAERERKCPPTPPEVQPEPVSAPTAVKPLIPEWGEEPAGPSRRTEPRRRRLRQAVQSWQDTEGEISPVVTGCQALAEKAKNTRRHWRRLSRAQVSLDGYRGMASWTGTMFEYLMPELLLTCRPNSLLYESARFCLFAQKRRSCLPFFTRRSRLVFFIISRSAGKAQPTPLFSVSKLAGSRHLQ